jgi:hypothetical protein
MRCIELQSRFSKVCLTNLECTIQLLLRVNQRRLLVAVYRIIETILLMDSKNLDDSWKQLNVITKRNF